MAESSSDGLGQGALDSYGWSREVGGLLSGLDGRGSPGRVVRTDRGAVLAATRQGLRHVGIPPGLDPSPVAGDWVLVDGTPPRIVRVAPRRNALVRRDEQHSQTLATGVDEVFVVRALDRPVATGPLDRALVLACASGAQPVVVLTKADLCDDAPGVAEDVARQVPGIDVIVTSCVDGRGLGDLRARLGLRRTIALLGESGVGKSSLVNALAGTAVQPTGEVRARDRQGRHTTRARHLVPVGGGTVLIDTPGLRAFGVVGLEAGLRLLFEDIEEIARGCRFTDCTHGGEPGCAIADAVAHAALEEARADRYRHLVQAVGAGQPAGPGASRRSTPAGRHGRRRRPAP